MTGTILRVTRDNGVVLSMQDGGEVTIYPPSVPRMSPLQKIALIGDKLDVRFPGE